MNSSLRTVDGSGMTPFSRLAAASLNDTSETLSENVEKALSRVWTSGWGIGGGAELLGGAAGSATSEIFSGGRSRSTSAWASAIFVSCSASSRLSVWTLARACSLDLAIRESRYASAMALAILAASSDLWLLTVISTRPVLPSRRTSMFFLRSSAVRSCVSFWPWPYLLAQVSFKLSFSITLCATRSTNSD